MDITTAVRCEIISSIATLVMIHTMSPTPEEKTILAQRLVAEHPLLADSYGCGYVSQTIRTRVHTSCEPFAISSPNPTLKPCACLVGII